MTKKNEIGAGTIFAIGGGIFVTTFVILIFLSGQGLSVISNLGEPKMAVQCKAKVQNKWAADTKFSELSCTSKVTKPLAIVSGQPLFIIPIAATLLGGVITAIGTAKDTGTLVLDIDGITTEKKWECDEPDILSPLTPVVCDLGILEIKNLKPSSYHYELRLQDEGGKVFDTRSGQVNP